MISRRHLLAFAPLGALLAGTRTAAAEADTYSEAERLLFTGDHFKSLTSPAKIDYEYRKRGSLEEEFTDKVRVAVSAKKSSGGRDVKVDFLTGNRRLELPEVQDALGNPLILYFLEREVREMTRLTGGSTNYYRKRIRVAFAESAQIKPATLTVGGKQVQAREIHIAPYREDPARSRYEKFAEKTFVLALSEEVPGSVVEMRSELVQPSEPALVIAESVKYVARR